MRSDWGTREREEMVSPRFIEVECDIAQFCHLIAYLNVFIFHLRCCSAVWASLWYMSIVLNTRLPLSFSCPDE